MCLVKQLNDNHNGWYYKSGFGKMGFWDSWCPGSFLCFTCILNKKEAHRGILGVVPSSSGQFLLVAQCCVLDTGSKFITWIAWYRM